MKLNGKIILITGATSGIGYELAKRLQPDNTVLITGTNAQKLEQMKANGFYTFQCDLNVNEEIENLILQIKSKFKHLDVLFNNAGVQYNYTFHNEIIPVSKIFREINVNLTGQVILTNLVLPLMLNSGGGMIVNTTSALSRFPKQNGLVYSISKSGMQHFTLGLKYFLKKHNIKVVEFIPPVTATKMTSGREESKMQPKDLVSCVLPQIEAGKRIATTKKIRMFLFLSMFFPSVAHRILRK